MAATQQLRILVTGAAGLVGSALVPRLESHGHKVIKLRRGSQGPAPALVPDAPYWDIPAGLVELGPAGRLDAVIHLAGENVGQRWSKRAKHEIRDSRVRGTALLSEALARMPEPPRTLLCASAIGYYGDRGADWLEETSTPGKGFLPEVVRAWEEAASPARARGIRLVTLRLGIVLSPRGGALARMLPAFRFGMAGPLGDGRQYWSWILLEDVLAAIDFLLLQEPLRGPINVVSPKPATNREFTSALARVLRRPAWMRLPRLAVVGLLGQMGREALLASARVRPAVLQSAGFEFLHPDLEPALRSLLGR